MHQTDLEGQRLAAIGPRNPTGPDVVAWLNICERRLQHSGDCRVLCELEGDRTTIGRLAGDGIAVDSSIVPLTRWFELVAARRRSQPQGR